MFGHTGQRMYVMFHSEENGEEVKDGRGERGRKE